jgi:hypothetical protein
MEGTGLLLQYVKPMIPQNFSLPPKRCHPFVIIVLGVPQCKKIPRTTMIHKDERFIPEKYFFGLFLGRGSESSSLFVNIVFSANYLRIFSSLLRSR